MTYRTKHDDDLIASLMQELGDRQGYHRHYGSNVITSDCAHTSDHLDSQRRRQHTTGGRLIPELKEYPHNTYQAGSHSAWNPLVAGGGPAKLTSLAKTEASRMISYHPIMLPTNSYIEVIRKRVFEKFRQDSQNLIHEAFLGGGSMAKQSQNANWVRKLPIPALLEKWQMDTKRQEQSQCREQTHAVSAAFDLNRYYTTSEILRIRQDQKEKNRPINDPVLLSKQAPSLFIEILRLEVQKMWQRHQNKTSEKPDTSTDHARRNDDSFLPPNFQKRAHRIRNGLYRVICESLDVFEKQIVQQAQKESTQVTLTASHKRPRGRPKIKQLSNVEDKNAMVQISFAGVKIKLHVTYFEKLQRLYDRSLHRQQQQLLFDIANYPPFEEAAFCLLCRYDMIQGAGLQAGVPGKVMDVLLEHYHCRLECFASPLNCRYDRFGSAFPDVDGWFGSLGSFFDWIDVDESVGSQCSDDSSDHGICYQANPPFCDGLIQDLNVTITTVLQKKKRPTMFVVFVPAWRSSKSYENLTSNEFLTKHILLEQGQHWYAEGTRHRRKDSFRVASFDTSILFYQNDFAKKLWDLSRSESCLKDLKEAFCQDPSKEVLHASAPKIPTEKKLAKSKSKNVATKKEEKKIGKVVVRGHKTKNRDDDAFAMPKQKKRKWINQEETKAQLDLLHSLGLSSASNERSFPNHNT